MKITIFSTLLTLALAAPQDQFMESTMTTMNHRIIDPIQKFMDKRQLPIDNLGRRIRTTATQVVEDAVAGGLIGEIRNKGQIAKSSFQNDDLGEKGHHIPPEDLRKRQLASLDLKQLGHFFRDHPEQLLAVNVKKRQFVEHIPHPYIVNHIPKQLLEDRLRKREY